MKRCEQRSANRIGAIYVAATAIISGAARHSALIAKRGNACRAYRRSGTNS